MRKHYYLFVEKNKYEYFLGNFDNIFMNKKSKWGAFEMKQENIIDILEQLKSGTLSEYYVKKEDFAEFRELLVKRMDFKYFCGIGQRGGDIIFKYQKIPRS